MADCLREDKKWPRKKKSNKGGQCTTGLQNAATPQAKEGLGRKALKRKIKLAALKELVTQPPDLP